MLTTMIKFILDDKPLFGLLSLSAVLEAFHRFILAHQADMNALISIGQLIVIGFTVYHLIRKQVKKRHEKNHPTPPPAADSP